jgi:signal transduction histidine kinase
MTLRSKILLVAGLICATLITVAALIIARLSLSSYVRLEQQIAERDLERIDKALEDGVEQLVIAGRGYAYWNDTQAYILGEYPEYHEDNGLDDNIFSEIDIDSLIFADVAGQVVLDRFFDGSQARPLDEATLQLLRPLLERDFGDVSEPSGFITLPSGPALVATLPILNNLGEGDFVGTMLVARYLDEGHLEHMDGSSSVSARVTTLAESNLPTKKAELQNGAYLIERASQVLKGYHLLPSIDGHSTLLLVIEEPRTIYQQGLRSVLALIAVLVLLGMAAVTTVVLLLERTLLRRLSSLSKSVRTISETGDITARTKLAGKDELSFLSADINRMLSSLEHQEKALRESNQELEQFAYVASHDLQEPLRKVQAFSDRLANKYADKLDDDGKLYIARMQDATTRMRSLIQDLLSYSRIRSKGQEFVSVDLNEIVRGVISDLEVRLEQTEGRVKVGELPTVLADPVQMRQVFQNLIGNALKFKKSGVPPVVKVAAKTKDKGHVIVVEDNGIGFEQEYGERVFEIFQRLHGRSEYEGTGMGLAIVKKILERHVGSIRAESEKGRGTRFILVLPNHKDANALVKKTLVEDAPRVDSQRQARTEMEKEFA